MSPRAQTSRGNRNPSEAPPGITQIGNPPKTGNGADVTSEAPSLTIPALATKRMTVFLTGTAPLICHAKDPSTIDAIEKKHEGKPVQRGKKDGTYEYEASLYTIPTRPGEFFMPGSAFKKCVVSACRQTNGEVAMTFMKGVLHVLDEWVRLPAKPYHYVVMKKLPRGGCEIRHRGRLDKWYVMVRIEYNSSTIIPQQILRLLSLAGFSVGVGDDRTELTGLRYGLFTVDDRVVLDDIYREELANEDPQLVEEVIARYGRNG